MLEKGYLLGCVIGSRHMIRLRDCGVTTCFTSHVHEVGSESRRGR